jgi:DNA modification methylase
MPYTGARLEHLGNSALVQILQSHQKRPYRSCEISANRQKELGLHPTVKPVAMIADAIKDVSTRSGIGGSGSTLIAAHKTGRKARLIELDPYMSIVLSDVGRNMPRMMPCWRQLGKHLR